MRAKICVLLKLYINKQQILRDLFVSKILDVHMKRHTHAGWYLVTMNKICMMYDHFTY